jgi:hypothetical protein
MLEKTSVSMMVLLVVAASLIGISSIHQYIEGQAPPPPAATPKPQQAQKAADFVTGHVLLVTILASSAGKACLISVELPDNQPNSLGLPPGTDIELLAPNESFCTLSGLSKIGHTQIHFDAQRITASSIPPAVRKGLQLSGTEFLFGVTRVNL